MHAQALIGIILAAVVIGGGVYWYTQDGTPAPESDSMMMDAGDGAGDAMDGDQAAVTDGTYVIATADSVVHWAAKKPLIDGYVNSGTIGLSEGTVTVAGESVDGFFVIDMHTLAVGLTAKKPGREGALESHLKKSDFFDVEKYPTASFRITNVAKQSDSDTTFTYDVTGDLTMKGVTNEVTFPARIKLVGGRLVADATLAIDRTKWGITFGSGNFFEGLADNVIDDLVQLSLTLVADRQ